jgi:hypothetical protein
MEGTIMSKLWRYRREGEECGPVTSADLKLLAAGGRLTPTTPIRQEGKEKWVHAGAVRGLFEDGRKAGSFWKGSPTRGGIAATILGLLVVVAVPMFAMAHWGTSSSAATPNSACVAPVPTPLVAPPAPVSPPACTVERPVVVPPVVVTPPAVITPPTATPPVVCAPPAKRPSGRRLLDALKEMWAGRANLTGPAGDVGGHRSIAVGALDAAIRGTEKALRTARVPLPAAGDACPPAAAVDLRCALNDIVAARADINAVNHGALEGRTWTLGQLNAAAEQVTLAMNPPEAACPPPVNACGPVPHPVFYHGYPVCP